MQQLHALAGGVEQEVALSRSLDPPPLLLCSFDQLLDFLLSVRHAWLSPGGEFLSPTDEIRTAGIRSIGVSPPRLQLWRRLRPCPLRGCRGSWWRGGRRPGRCRRSC